MKNPSLLQGFPGGSAGKESACNVGDMGSIPGLGRSPGDGNSYPLQESGLENFMVCIWGHKELDTTERLSLSLKKNGIHININVYAKETLAINISSFFLLF